MNQVSMGLRHWLKAHWCLVVRVMSGGGGSTRFRMADWWGVLFVPGGVILFLELVEICGNLVA